MASKLIFRQQEQELLHSRIAISTHFTPHLKRARQHGYFMAGLSYEFLNPNEECWQHNVLAVLLCHCPSDVV
jgi:hypothetical protein